MKTYPAIVAAAFGAVLWVLPVAAETPSATDGSLNSLLPEKIRKAGVIHLATDAHYPTCNYYDESGQTLIGFSPDIWKGLERKLGVRIEATSIDFASLIPSVQSGRFDMASECMSDRAEREKVVTFIDFMTATNTAYALKSDTRVTEDPLSVCGLRGAAQSGTTFAQAITSEINKNCVANGKPEAQLQEYSSADAALLALYSGRADFNSNDPTTLRELEKSAPKPIKSFAYKIFKRDYVGMIVDKNNMDTAAALLAGLKALHADGTMGTIARTWAIEEFMLPEPGLNLTTTMPMKD